MHSEKNSGSPSGPSSSNPQLGKYLKKAAKKRDKAFERQTLEFLRRRLLLDRNFASLKQMNEIACLPFAFDACKVSQVSGLLTGLIRAPSKTELWGRYIDLLCSYQRPVALVFNTGGAGRWVMFNDMDFPLERGIVRRDLSNAFLATSLPHFVDYLTLEENQEW